MFEPFLITPSRTKQPAIVPTLDALKKISIIDVEVAHDLKNAKVFYVADHDDEEIVKGLKRSLPFFRTLLAKRMSTRGIPKLHFEYDKTIDESTKISKLLDSVI